MIECIQSSGWTGYMLMKVRQDFLEVGFVKVPGDDEGSVRMFVVISAELVVEFGQSQASIQCLGLQRVSRVYTDWSKKEKISRERQLCGRKCLVGVRGQRRMGRLVRDDRKATVTQITTRYNQGMQNTVSEHATRRTLKQMGYSSRRPHRVPLLSAKDRKQRIQLTQDHQNWTI